jgi:hypothetical protein
VMIGKLSYVRRDLPGSASDSAFGRILRGRLVRYVLVLGAAVLGGCAQDTGKPPQEQNPALRADLPTAQISNNDECASRLHDIIEPLFLYYTQHHRLPSRLEELRQMRGFENLQLSCPVSKLPYVYNPVGIITLDNQPRMVCYDAAPSHSKMRWAISIIEPRGEGPLVAKVVAVPESAFTLTMPK